MRRVRLREQPDWDGVIAGWSVNYIRENIWRFRGHHSFEDLLHEAYVKFLHVKQHYPDITKPPHFMALYKAAVLNHFHDLARRESYYGALPDELGGPASFELYIETIPDNSGLDPETHVAMATAPPEVQELLAAFDNPEFLNVIRQKGRRWKTGTTRLVDGGLHVRETTNEILCRALGYDHTKIDLVGMVRDHFRG